MIDSVVPFKKVKNDPRELVYHYPSIPNVKMSKILNTYFYWRSVQIGEEIAKITGYIFVPGGCMHWKRKRALIDRRVYVSGRSFYVLKKNEMTKNEINNYMNIVSDVRSDASGGD